MPIQNYQRDALN